MIMYIMIIPPANCICNHSILMKVSILIMCCYE
nr:MAG TPA: hypothetical protein [Caudoviricetes sp.]